MNGPHESKRARKAPTDHNATPASALMLALEPRIMFDAAAAATLADALHVAHHDTAAAHHTAHDNSHSALTQALSKALAAHQPPSDTVHPHEVLFVDGNVADYQSIVKDATSGTKVVVLDPNKDGMDQIAAYLQSHHDISSIGIVSHGSQGLLLLGNTGVFSGNLDHYRADLHTIGQALGPHGDILLYGCDVGAGASGHAFVDAIARATGAHVAASNDATGAASLGGDWNLEVTTGSIDAAPMLDTAALGSYDHVLATQTASSASQLQADIATDNTNGTADTITLTANIDLSGTPITIDVTDGNKLTIVGGGYTIDAHYLSQVIHVTAGTVEIDNTTLQHGLVSGNGGTEPANTTGAAGGDSMGAGIYNAGTLTLNGDTITANYASGGGGAAGGSYDGVQGASTVTYGNSGGGGGGRGCRRRRRQRRRLPGRQQCR